MKQEERELDELMRKLEAEQPSMRFTKNVMESIVGLQIAPSAGRYINLLVVRSIAALLVLSLVIACMYVLISPGATNVPFAYNKLTSHIPHSYAWYIVGFNIILLLVLAELWLSSKRRIKYLERMN
ncbi:MAG: hypothetical protein JST82_15215 [Bacteroidetes bacterium]|nr:hypothetical protein [Bacteroidota bacterium]